jgi:hypothetical protein
LTIATTSASVRIAVIGATGPKVSSRAIHRVGDAVEHGRLEEQATAESVDAPPADDQPRTADERTADVSLRLGRGRLVVE